MRIAAPTVRTRAAVCATSSGAVLSFSVGAEVSGISSSSSSVSRRSRGREWRWQAVAEQLLAGAPAETEENSVEGGGGGGPSDSLSVFLEAEGALAEASVVKLTTALEEVEGVSNVHITASSEGSATVKLTKQMGVQETGVASGLVEILLKGGFKLQALNLAFDEENGDDDDFYEYDVSSSTEESVLAE